MEMKVTEEHPVPRGVADFAFPEKDEHYQMKMLNENGVTILADTVSEHGTWPGLWVSEYGEGRICCLTPAHNTTNMLCDGYSQIFRNAVKWCMNSIDR